MGQKVKGYRGGGGVMAAAKAGRQEIEAQRAAGVADPINPYTGKPVSAGGDPFGRDLPKDSPPPAYDWTQYEKVPYTVTHPTTNVTSVVEPKDIKVEKSGAVVQETAPGSNVYTPVGGTGGVAYNANTGRVEMYVPEPQYGLYEELENQYNAVVSAVPSAAWPSHESNRKEVMLDQATQLHKAGVKSIADLKIINGQLVDTAQDNKVVSSISGDAWGSFNEDRLGKPIAGQVSYGVTTGADNTPVFYPIWKPEDRNGLFDVAFGVTLGVLSGGLAGPIGAGLGLTGTAAAVAGGAVTGAAVSAAMGGDPLKGAIMGGIGNISSTTYAAKVGESLGLAGNAATTVGNAVINSGLSGLAAAATGGDVAEAMKSGAILGAVMVNADDLASTLVGGEENLAAIAAKTNLSTTQMADLITRSVTNGVVAELSGKDFGEYFTESLVAGGLSTSAANFAAGKIGDNLSPEATRAIATGVKGITDTSVRAALDGKDVGTALETALPTIAVAASTQYGKEVNERKINEDPKLSALPAESRVLLAQADFGTLSDAMASGIEPHILPNIVVSANRAGIDSQTLLEQAIEYWDRISPYFKEAAKPEASTISLLTGIVTGTKSVMGAFGAGKEGVFGEQIEKLDEVEKSLQDLMTAEAVGDKQRAYEIMIEAEGKGILEELKAGAEAFFTRPVQATMEAVGSTAPALLTAALAGPSVLGAMTAQGVVGGMMGVGEVKNEIYKEIYKAARDRGLSEADAIQMATAASAYDGPLADQQAIAAAIGVAISAGPLAGLEKALVGDIASLAASKIAGRATLAGTVETLTEAGQALQQKMATNIGTQRLQDPSEEEIRLLGDWSEASRAYREFIAENPWARDTMEGAIAAATYEGLSSSAVGAGVSLGVDVAAKAQTDATKQGVQWELLDPVSKTDLMVRALLPQDVIDVTAREVGPLLLQGPEDATSTLREQDRNAVTEYVQDKAKIAEVAEAGNFVDYAADVELKRQTGLFEDYKGDIVDLTRVADLKIEDVDVGILNLMRERINLLNNQTLTPTRNQEIIAGIEQLNAQRDQLLDTRNTLVEQTETLVAPTRTAVDPARVAAILELTPEQAGRYGLVLPPTDSTPEVSTDPSRTPVGVSPESAQPPGAPGAPTLYPGATVDPSLVEQELAAVNVERTPLRPFIPPDMEQYYGSMQFQPQETKFESLFPEETWLGGRFRLPADVMESVRDLIPETVESQESQVYSALRRASGVEGAGPQTFLTPPGATPSYYAYGTETSPGSVLQGFKRGGTIQEPVQDDTISVSPLRRSTGDGVEHKGTHYVQGAGGGQDDLIPAKLADGEYVFDAEIVAALGDGSNKEGAKILDRFREEIRKHKRGGSAKTIPPKAKNPLAYLRSVL